MKPNKLARLFLFIGLISTSMLVGCTRDKGSSGKVQLSFPQGIAGKAGALAIDPNFQLMHIVVNVRGPGIPGIINWNWDGDNDDSAGAATTALPPGEIVLDVPAGDARLIQYMGVYSHVTTGEMNFFYGDKISPINSGDNFVTINAASIGSSSGTEHQVAGRYKTTAATGPTGILQVLVSPPAAQYPNRPPMLLMEKDMIGGWFSAMLIDGIKFAFRLQPQNLDLFELDPSVHLTGTSDSLMHVYAPAHIRNNETKVDQPWQLHLGYFGPGASGNEKICYRTDTNPISNMTKPDGTTPIQWNGGTVSDASSEIYRTGGMSEDNGTYSALCNDLNDANSFLFEYAKLSNGVRDGIGMLGPFMTNFNTSADQGMIVTQSGANMQIAWKFLPGVTSSAKPLSGVSIYTRPKNAGDTHVRGDDISCDMALTFAGFVFEKDVPATLESDILFGRNESDTAVALCPYTDAFGSRIYFTSFLQRGSEGGNSGGPGGGNPATQLEIKFLQSLTNFNTGVCFPAELLAKDSNGDIGIFSSADSISFIAGGSGTFTTWEDEDCLNGIASMSFAAGDWGHKTFYVKMNTAGSPDISTSNSTGLGNVSNMSFNIGSSVSVAPSSGMGYKIFARYPDVYKYECVPVYVFPVDGTGAPAMQYGTDTTVYFDDNGHAGQFYYNGDCSGTNTVVHTFYAGDHGEVFYYKNTTVGAEIGGNLRVGDNGLTIVYGMTNINFKLPGVPVRTFTWIQPSYSSQKHHTGLCYPLKVHLEDQNGMDTAADIIYNYDVSINPGDAYLFATSDCSGAPSNSLTGAFAVGSLTREDFYIMPLVPGSVDILVEVAGWTAESFSISTDMTQLISTSAPGLTGSFCETLYVELQDSLFNPISASDILGGQTFDFMVTSDEAPAASGLSPGAGCSGTGNSNSFSRAVNDFTAEGYVYYETTVSGTVNIDFDITGSAGDGISPSLFNSFSW